MKKSLALVLAAVLVLSCVFAIFAVADTSAERVNLALGKDVSGAEPAKQASCANYVGKLTDGVKAPDGALASGGDHAFSNRNWFAYYYNTSAKPEEVNTVEVDGTQYGIATIDLGEVCSVDEVIVNTMATVSLWGIKSAKSIEVLTSVDGEAFTSVAVKTGADFNIPTDGSSVARAVSYKLGSATDARYVRVKVALDGVFAFLDEIEVWGTKIAADPGATIVEERITAIDGVLNDTAWANVAFTKVDSSNGRWQDANTNTTVNYEYAIRTDADNVYIAVKVNGATAHACDTSIEKFDDYILTGTGLRLWIDADNDGATREYLLDFAWDGTTYAAYTTKVATDAIKSALTYTDNSVTMEIAIPKALEADKVIGDTFGICFTYRDKLFGADDATYDCLHSYYYEDNKTAPWVAAGIAMFPKVTAANKLGTYKTYEPVVLVDLLPEVGAYADYTVTANKDGSVTVTLKKDGTVQVAGKGAGSEFNFTKGQKTGMYLLLDFADDTAKLDKSYVAATFADGKPTNAGTALFTYSRSKADGTTNTTGVYTSSIPTYTEYANGAYTLWNQAGYTSGSYVKNIILGTSIPVSGKAGDKIVIKSFAVLAAEAFTAGTPVCPVEYEATTDMLPAVGEYDDYTVTANKNGSITITLKKEGTSGAPVIVKGADMNREFVFTKGQTNGAYMLLDYVKTANGATINNGYGKPAFDGNKVTTTGDALFAYSRVNYEGGAGSNTGVYYASISAPNGSITEGANGQTTVLWNHAAYASGSYEKVTVLGAGLPLVGAVGSTIVVNSFALVDEADAFTAGTPLYPVEYVAPAPVNVDLLPAVGDYEDYTITANKNGSITVTLKKAGTAAAPIIVAGKGAGTEYTFTKDQKDGMFLVLDFADDTAKLSKEFVQATFADGKPTYAGTALFTYYRVKYDGTANTTGVYTSSIPTYTEYANGAYTVWNQASYTAPSYETNVILGTSIPVYGEVGSTIVINSFAFVTAEDGFTAGTPAYPVEYVAPAPVNVDLLPEVGDYEDYTITANVDGSITITLKKAGTADAPVTVAGKGAGTEYTFTKDQKDGMFLVLDFADNTATLSKQYVPATFADGKPTYAGNALFTYYRVKYDGTANTTGVYASSIPTYTEYANGAYTVWNQASYTAPSYETNVILGTSIPVIGEVGDKIIVNTFAFITAEDGFTAGTPLYPVEYTEPDDSSDETSSDDTSSDDTSSDDTTTEEDTTTEDTTTEDTTSSSSSESSASSSESSESSATSTPENGDSGILVFAVLAIVALAGVAVAVRIRH